MPNVKKTHVKSFYSGVLVTCYEYNSLIYVSNQHGHFDVYEGEYVRGEKKRVAQANSDEIKDVIALYKKDNPQG